MEHSDAFWAEARYPEQVDELGPLSTLQTFERAQVARRHDLGDLRSDGLADSVKLGEILTGGHHFHEPARGRANRHRCISIGPHAKRVGALDREQIRVSLQSLGNLGVLERNDSPPLQPLTMNRTRAGQGRSIRPIYRMQPTILHRHTEETTMQNTGQSMSEYQVTNCNRDPQMGSNAGELLGQDTR